MEWLRATNELDDFPTFVKGSDAGEKFIERSTRVWKFVNIKERQLGLFPTPTMSIISTDGK